jgi:hypothetical protein
MIQMTFEAARAIRMIEARWSTSISAGRSSIRLFPYSNVRAGGENEAAGAAT